MLRPSQMGASNVSSSLMSVVAVVLHDSDEHTMPYCIEMLGRCFGYNEEDAYRLTYLVHSCRRAVVWTGNIEVAELKCEQVAEFMPRPPLVRSVSMPSRASFPSRPMKVTIESVPFDIERARAD